MTFSANLLAHARALRKWIALAILVGGVAAGSAYVATARSPIVYQASATIQVVPADSANAPTNLNLGQVMPAAVAILQSPKVMHKVESDLGLKHSLAGLVTVTPQPAGPIITVQAQDPNPKLAAAIANEFVTAYDITTTADDQDRRDAQVKQLKDQLASQEALLRADAAAIAPLSDPGLAREPAAAADLAVLTAKERVDSANYSDLVGRLQQVENYPLEDYQLSVITSATPGAATAPHSTRSLKIALAAAAGVVAVLGVGFLLTSPVPVAHPELRPTDGEPRRRELTPEQAE